MARCGSAAKCSTEKRTITDDVVENATRPDLIWDDEARGLCVRTYPDGSNSFIFSCIILTAASASSELAAPPDYRSRLPVKHCLTSITRRSPAADPTRPSSLASSISPAGVLRGFFTVPNPLRPRASRFLPATPAASQCSPQSAALHRVQRSCLDGSFRQIARRKIGLSPNRKSTNENRFGFLF